MTGKLRTFSVAAAAALALLIAAFTGTAVAKDRNHDQIPDKWEKRYHLSLKVNQANKDQDHDTVGNLDEFQEGTSPRDPDSDDDGVLDGNDENEGADDQGDDGTADDPGDQGEDNEGDESGDENNEVAGVIATFEGGVLTINLDGGGQVSGAVDSNTEIDCESASSDVEEPSEDSCTADDLSPGTVVHDAELDGGSFTEVELVK